MMTFCKSAIAALSLTVLAAGILLAADWDGSRPLSGVTENIIEISRYRIDDDVEADTLGLPKKFRIDFEARMLTPSRDSVIRKTVPIGSVAHIENTIVLQGVDAGVEGVEDGLAWSLVISKKDGKAVLSASGNGVAYVVFGQCSPVVED